MITSFPFWMYTKAFHVGGQLGERPPRAVGTGCQGEGEKETPKHLVDVSADIFFQWGQSYELSKNNQFLFSITS